MANLNRFTAPLWDLDVFHVFDDFWMDQTDLTFVDTVTDSGSVAIGDATRGIATLTPSDGTVADNDEVYLASANELFLFAAGRPIYGRCRLQFTETASGVYNAAFGFQNAVGANSLIDDGGGPKVSGSTLAIAKIDGETVWRLYTACNGVSTTTKSQTTAGGSAYQVLEIFCEDVGDGVNMRVLAKVDGEYLKDANGYVIRHTVAIASATEMQVFAGAKLGAATNNDVLLVDYIYAHQAR